MKNLHTFEEFLNESVLNEGDMTRDYDGFKVYDQKNKTTYKFHYIKGQNSVKVEDAAIQKLMNFTKQSRANFMVHGFVRKREWDKDETPEFED